MIHEKRLVDATSILKAGGTIVAFKIHRYLKVCDLCQYIKSSLDKACKAWGVPAELSKKSFDHEKISSFETAEEHRGEVLEYLEYDVLSLKTLYKIFSDAQWECFHRDINRAVSLSQFGLQAWQDTISEIIQAGDIYIPHAGKEERDDRAAYYGGRVLCQRQEYQSKDFVEDQLYYDYEKITDSLKMLDANSLYPFAQKKYQYAYGKWEYLASEYIEAFHDDLVRSINTMSDPEWMRRSSFHVDVTCPKDLLTPFLFSRGKDGLKQNLDDKIGQWYWGTELMEAVLLGMIIKKVKKISEGPYSSPSQFIHV